MRFRSIARSVERQILLGVTVVALLALRRAPDVLLLVLLIESVLAGWMLSARLAALTVGMASVILLLKAFLTGSAAAEALIEIVAIAALAFFAHLSATVIGPAQPVGAHDRRSDQLIFLAETGHALAEALDWDRILAIAVAAVDKEISRAGSERSSHASFHAVDDEEATITVVVDDQPGRTQSLGFTYRIDQNQAARTALRTRTTAFVRPDHMNGALLQLAVGLDWQVLMMAPVFAAGELAGFLTATARDAGRVDRGRLRMLEVLASMTGLALGNAKDVETRAVGNGRLSRRHAPDLRTLRTRVARKGEAAEVRAGAAKARRDLGRQGDPAGRQPRALR